MGQRAGSRLALGLRQSSLARRLFSRLGAFYIRLVHRTTRWQVEGRAEVDAILDARSSGVIAAIWHGRLFLSPTYAPDDGRRSIAMISNNRDGELISAIVARFGIEAVRGSTHDRRKRRSKGGVDAYQAALRALTDDRAVVAITPDGPRGPRMRAQPGVSHLALASACPVVPVGFSTRWGVMFRSWDRFLLPLPFGRGALIFGAPIDASGEEPHLRARIEQAVTEVTDRADDLCGRTAVPPGPALASE